VSGQAPVPESFELRPPVPVPDFARFGSSGAAESSSLEKIAFAAVWTCEERAFEVRLSFAKMSAWSDFC
jgi:hypothetical protein